jgi:hypothetical protein
MGLLGRQWNRAAAALGTHGFSVDLNGPLTLCRLKEWLKAQGLGSDPMALMADNGVTCSI